MAWETDQPPTEYLRRRIIYYKKKRGSIRNFIKSDLFIRTYGGKRNLKRLISARIVQIEDRIKEYETAIKFIENGIKRISAKAKQDKVGVRSKDNRPKAKEASKKN